MTAKLGRRRWLVWVGVAAIADGTLAVGCNPAADKVAMEELCGRLFALIRIKDYEAAADLYDARFYQTTPRGEWIALLSGVTRKLGDLQRSELVAWNMRQVAGTGTASGTYGDMQYKTTYERYPATEELTLFRPAGSGGPYRILGHKINSEGFLRD